MNALIKRALGYDYEEVTTLIEETKSGTKKKISKVRKHVPPDPASARYLLEGMNPTPEDFEEAIGEFKEKLRNVAD